MDLTSTRLRFLLLLLLSAVLTGCDDSGGGTPQAAADTQDDPSVLIRADFRDRSAVLADGWVEEGTGYRWDADKGFSPGTSGGHVALTARSFTPTLQRQGTVYVEVERAGIAYETLRTWFYWNDSKGDSTDREDHVIWEARSAVWNDHRHMLHRYVNGEVRASVRTEGVGASADLPAYNSRLPDLPGIDPRFTSIALTWRDFGSEIVLVVDGCIVHRWSRSGPPDPSGTEFEEWRVGAAKGGNSPLGDHFVRRLRVSTSWSGPSEPPPILLGVIGDSFAVGGDNRRAYDPPGKAPDAAAVDTLQHNLDYGDRMPRLGGFGQNHFLYVLQSQVWRDFGYFLPVYNAGASGHHWRAGENRIGHAYSDALKQASPDVILFMATVNDIAPSIPAGDELVAEIKGRLDDLIDGIPGLRKILFVETVPSHRDPGRPEGWLEEHLRQIALYRGGGLDGYRGMVEYVPLWEPWGGEDYPSCYQIGACDDPDNPRYGNDVHLSARGNVRLAEILYPYLQRAAREIDALQ